MAVHGHEALKQDAQYWNSKVEYLKNHMCGLIGDKRRLNDEVSHLKTSKEQLTLEVMELTTKKLELLTSIHELQHGTLTNTGDHQ